MSFFGEDNADTKLGARLWHLLAVVWGKLINITKPHLLIYPLERIFTLKD